MKEDIVSPVMSGVMFITSATIFYKSLQLTPHCRFYYYMCFTISSLAGVSYAAMMCWDDNIIRYIEWILTTPAELIILGSMSEIGFINIYMMCLFDVIMIILGAMSQFTKSIMMTYAYMVISVMCLLPIIYFLFFEMDYSALQKAENQFRAVWVTRFLMITWIMYPVVWALDVFSVIENRFFVMIGYSFLDMLSKFVLVIMILWITNDQISSLEDQLAITNAPIEDTSALSSEPSS